MLLRYHPINPVRSFRIVRNTSLIHENRDAIDATQLTATRGRVCAVRRSGDVACWGGSAQMAQLRHVELSGIRQLDLGWHSSCATLHDGRVSCWNLGTESETERSAEEPSTIPRFVVGLNDARRVAVGLISCALRRGGRIACWGPGYGAHPVEIDLPR